jgi:DNA-directed RNA polymerase specialized sigma24 family protein
MAEFSSVPPRHQFRAWLFRILFNLFYAEARNRGASLTMSISRIDSDAWPESAALVDSFVDSADVSRALAALRVEHKTGCCWE